MKKIIYHLFLILSLSPLTFGAIEDQEAQLKSHTLSSTLTVFVTMDPKPDRKEELMQLLLSVQQKSLAETEWCTGFRIFSLPDNKIHIVEDWANKEALDAHIQQPYIQDALPRLSELLVEDRTKFFGYEVITK